jgi:hypothetical protein
VDGDEVEWQMFTNRQRYLDIVPNEIRHNGSQANVALILRMVPHIAPQP